MKKATSKGGLLYCLDFVFDGLHFSASQGECRLLFPTEIQLQHH
ncbi:hypothetical protein NB714_004563 [Pantoea dispersa]|nr:hypothetical protein [Pantoea dispersa]MCW0328438.1 hypothetical protein [Pantoea dispersa]MCW0434863.1 hypothetical protein [Pantoea dispersa]